MRTVDYDLAIRSEIETQLLEHQWDYEYDNDSFVRAGGEFTLARLKTLADNHPDLVRAAIGQLLPQLMERMPMPEYWFINQVGLMV